MNPKEKAIDHIRNMGIMGAGFDENNIHFKKALDIAIEEANKNLLKDISDYRVKTGCILIKESAFDLLKNKHPGGK